jgi:hypothetical protein
MRGRPSRTLPRAEPLADRRHPIYSCAGPQPRDLKREFAVTPSKGATPRPLLSMTQRLAFPRYFFESVP